VCKDLEWLHLIGKYLLNNRNNSKDFYWQVNGNKVDHPKPPDFAVQESLHFFSLDLVPLLQISCNVYLIIHHMQRDCCCLWAK
jgi:hypothetical protein